MESKEKVESEKYRNNVDKLKEKVELEKYRNNVYKLNRLMEKISVFLANLKISTQKVKELENKLQNVSPIDLGESKSSTKGKRENTNVSYTQEDGLNPSQKHDRHV